MKPTPTKIYLPKNEIHSHKESMPIGMNPLSEMNLRDWLISWEQSCLPNSDIPCLSHPNSCTPPHTHTHIHPPLSRPEMSLRLARAQSWQGGSDHRICFVSFRFLESYIINMYAMRGKKKVYWGKKIHPKNGLKTYLYQFISCILPLT